MIEATELRQAPARPAYVDRLVVLDDDPTGVQTLAGIRVLLAWDDPGANRPCARGQEQRPPHHEHARPRARRGAHDRRRGRARVARRGVRCPTPATRRQHPAGSPARGVPRSLRRARSRSAAAPARPCPALGGPRHTGGRPPDRAGRPRGAASRDRVRRRRRVRLLHRPSARVGGGAVQRALSSQRRARAAPRRRCGRVEPTRWPPHSSASPVRTGRRCSHQTPRRRRTWRRSQPATRRRC